MEFKDYYKTLGVERTADQKGISSAYRRLARKFHPDVNKDRGAEDRFKQINEAYQVLGKPDQRAKYDQLFEAYQHGGVDWQQMFGRGGTYQTPEGWTVTFGGDAGNLEDLLGGFSDFFKQFFGQDFARQAGGPFGRRRPFDQAQGRRRVGEELSRTSTLEVTLEEAFRGSRKAVALQLNGSTRRLDVTIPRGVRDGQTIRLSGALDGGDLYLTIKVQPHTRFERRDDDIVVDLPVSLSEAMLGGKVEVPTLEGSVEMAIPPETQNGQLFRLRGQGMPKRTGGRGDQLVRVEVTLPKKLSAREKQLFEELGKLRKENPRQR
ncbi:MAG: DnaJ domain-containing protein [Armatimonadetes bacterium]|nr:DnaJ domain-containing protein [Armatimonadota bacterium]